MLEDELLKLRFLCGSSSALAQIYRKYADRLLALATALLRDANAAEDVLHDVFVKLAQANGSFRLRGSLRSYLATCVANRARDVLRRRRSAGSLADMPEAERAVVPEPAETLEDREAAQRMARALCELPYEQREVLLLHVTADMSFRRIAEVQGVSLRTAQGRYRYAMKKLRSTLIRGDGP
jgi:RNA polymerase sigma-70 factor (ECF subfamily)